MDSQDITDITFPELPMTVWLRGDEDYFHEFTMDADAVMAQLQIKRSRLTQISGKELRVGRTRVDRYVRPVFRPADVQNYLQFTRAPLTKQKTKAEASEIQEQLTKTLTEMTIQRSQPSTAPLPTPTFHSQQMVTQLQRCHQKLSDQLQSLQHKVYRNLSESLEEQKKEIIKIEEQLLTLEAIAQSIPHIVYELKNIQATLKQTPHHAHQPRLKRHQPRYSYSHTAPRAVTKTSRALQTKIPNRTYIDNV